MRKIGLTIGLLCLATACGTLPERPPDTLEHYRITPQLPAFDGLTKSANPEHSSVMLLNDPREALLARLALADIARHTIDVQYYIWAADAVGAAIVARLLKAADRGVRVRILVDDLSLIGSDQRVQTLHNHPNVDVRAYNPFRFRKRYRILRRTLDIVSSAARINHRMHNKVFAIDNNAAIVGGRNLANSYFGADAQLSFRDIDILTLGPVVDNVSASFDAYWNSTWAIPVNALSQQNMAADSITAMKHRLDETSGELLSLIAPSSIEHFLSTNAHRLTWCVVEFVADPPSKSSGHTNFVSPVSKRLSELFQQSQREVLVENAYLIPGKEGVESVARQTSRGVRVQVLTNSLASNDSGKSHAGYKKYRKSMLEAGVELFELRPDANLRDTFDLSAVARASLHTKAAVIDEKIAIVGSFNLDPRSNYINTETSVIVHDEEFAKALADVLHTGVQIDNSWRLALDSRKRIEWHGSTGVQREPRATFRKRLTARILAWLPVEWLL